MVEESIKMRMFRVVVNGNEYQVGIEEIQKECGVTTKGVKSPPAPQAEKPREIRNSEPVKAAGNSDPGGNIVAPMPGTILRVDVSAGDTVVKGQTILILEAMKMENEILASTAGVVKQLNVSKGASVNPGEILAVIET
jgi:glutaconyl-CoA/methylmalonyl-CoA decarboxylase subunit gamma